MGTLVFWIVVVAAIWMILKKISNSFHQQVNSLRQKAEQGDLQAQLNLGNMYYAGSGGVKDNRQALVPRNIYIFG